MERHKKVASLDIDLFKVPDINDCMGQLFDARTIECQFCHASAVCATIYNNISLLNKKSELSAEKPFLDEVEPLHLLDFSQILTESTTSSRMLIKLSAIKATIKKYRAAASDALIDIYMTVELKNAGYIKLGEHAKYNGL